MVEWVEKLHSKYGVDMLHDVSLREIDSLYFLVEEGHKICNKPLIKLFGSFENIGIYKPIETIADIINSIDAESKICEIHGVKEYMSELN